MAQIYKAEDRGTHSTSWLESHHTFSFGNFHDANRMGYRNLRVINDDQIAPAGGFGLHGHNDMEIITYVTSGAIGHKDSLGNGSVIRPGEIQRMSAGTGIRHSELNASRTEPVHLLQIWIEPDKSDYLPSYEQVELIDKVGRQGFTEIASQNGGIGAISLNQNATLSVSKPIAGERVEAVVDAGRYGFLHIVHGEIEINGETLKMGDSLAFDETDSPLDVAALRNAEMLFFDLP